MTVQATWIVQTLIFGGLALLGFDAISCCRTPTPSAYIVMSYMVMACTVRANLNKRLSGIFGASQKSPSCLNKPDRGIFGARLVWVCGCD